MLEPDPEPSGPGMANSKAMPVLGEKGGGPGALPIAGTPCAAWERCYRGGSKMVDDDCTGTTVPEQPPEPQRARSRTVVSYSHEGGNRRRAPKLQWRHGTHHAAHRVH